MSRISSTPRRSEEHTSELQSLTNLVCRLLLEKKKCIVSDTKGDFTADRWIPVFEFLQRNRGNTDSGGQVFLSKPENVSDLYQEMRINRPTANEKLSLLYPLSVKKR